MISIRLGDLNLKVDIIENLSGKPHIKGEKAVKRNVFFIHKLPFIYIEYLIFYDSILLNIAIRA